MLPAKRVKKLKSWRLSKPDQVQNKINTVEPNASGKNYVYSGDRPIFRLNAVYR